MRILLFLIACNADSLSTPMDQSAGDPGDMSLCPGPNFIAPCTAGAVCDYGFKRCICQASHEFYCNDTGCPDQAVFTSSACPKNGLACYYGLTEDYCVDGKWLSCGDAGGLGCQEIMFGNVPKEGGICCPNDYVSQFRNGCECINGIQCSCDNYH